MAIIHKIKTAVLKNLLTKVLSILFAITLWAYVNSTVHTTEIFVIPVLYSNLPQNLQISRNNMVAEIEILVSGNKKEILKIEESKLLAHINLNNSKAGKKKILIKNEYINISKRVKIIKIHPRSFIILIEKNHA